MTENPENLFQNNTNLSNFFLMKLRQEGVKRFFYFSDEIPNYNQAQRCWQFKFLCLSSGVIYCNGKLDAEGAICKKGLNCMDC